MSDNKLSEFLYDEIHFMKLKIDDINTEIKVQQAMKELLQSKITQYEKALKEVNK